MDPISNQPSPARSPIPRRTKRLLWVAAGLVILAAIGGGWWWAQREASHKAAEKQKELQQEALSESFKHEATVQITAAGFLPSKITVERDTRIYFENKDKAVHTLIADDATAKAEPGLGIDEDTHRIQNIAPSGGHAYSFHNSGTFRAHDGHHPTANIEIEVK